MFFCIVTQSAFSFWFYVKVLLNGLGRLPSSFRIYISNGFGKDETEWELLTLPCGEQAQAWQMVESGMLARPFGSIAVCGLCCTHTYTHACRRPHVLQPCRREAAF